VFALFILAHGNSAAADELKSAIFESVTLREASSCPVQPSSHAVQQQTTHVDTIQTSVVKDLWPEDKDLRSKNKDKDKDWTCKLVLEDP